MIKEFLEKNILTGSRVAIVGAGTSGRYIKNYIERIREEQNRTDIKIVMFFDSFLDGKVDGIDVKNTKHIADYKHLFDKLIITKINDINLSTVLYYLDLPMVYITKEQETFIRNEGIKDIFEKQKRVLNLFSKEEDKNLYNLLFEVRTNTKLARLIEDYANQRHKIFLGDKSNVCIKQYLEYINKDEIRTIVDCGFCNGANALAFRKQMKNLKTIYAFEPMYDKFKIDYIDYYIQKENFVKILPYAAWSENTILDFCERVNSPGCSRVLGTSYINTILEDEVLHNVTAITINEAKKRENIEKVDFVKMDIEGAELQALKGGIQTIKEDRPQLAISIYHTFNDFVDIPLYLNENLDNYTFRLGHYDTMPIETVFYAIPNELYKN